MLSCFTTVYTSFDCYYSLLFGITIKVLLFTMNQWQHTTAIFVHYESVYYTKQGIEYSKAHQI